MRKRDLILPLTITGSAIFMIGLLVAGFLIIQASTSLPNAENIKNVKLKIPLRVYSAEQLLISEFGNERRKPSTIEQTPLQLIDAILASEDDGFFEHKGIDISGLIRAAISNFRSGETQQGASTITMQVARNFFLSREKTYNRKLREVLLAIKLEQILSKNQILTLYLNKIFLGHRAYGFAAAADVYYGKELGELSLAEMAMLAGLPKAPSSNNPLRSPERATNRRNYVLNRLREIGKISEAEYQFAATAPITAKKHARANEVNAPHIAEMVRAQLISEFGEDAYWQGLNVYTTIQAKEQAAAAKALRKGLQAYDQRHGFRGPIERIDLDTLYKRAEDDDASLEQLMTEALSALPNSVEQIPALVTAVDKDKALLQTIDHGIVSLSLDAMSWAKRHLSANRVADPPTSVGKLLSAGDVVYIQANSPSNADQPVSTPEWRLSQIPNVSSALISMHPDSGRILSLVGGYDFFLNKYNRAVQSIRQPGSNIKPFIYSASLDKGFTPASLISGAPIVMTDPTHGTVWRPENYSGKFYGPTRMREALGKSMNLVSIRLLRAIGVPYARDYAARFGIDMNRFSPTLTMALGSGGITPLEMLTAYSALANGGYKIQPYFIDYITDRDGEVVYRAKQAEFCDECYRQFVSVEDDTGIEESTTEAADATIGDPITEEAEDTADLDQSPHHDVAETYRAPRVMSRANNFLTVSMLKDVVRRGTARRALVLERNDLAGKTGTTNDYVDAWFTGFNSQVATTVWVGFDDPATLGRGETGSKAALPIWVDYMKTGLEEIPQDPEEIPDYIAEGFVNRYNGDRTDESDPEAVAEYFVVEALLPELERESFLATQTTAILEEGILETGEDNSSESEYDPGPSLPTEPRIIESSEDTEGLF